MWKKRQGGHHQRKRVQFSRKARLPESGSTNEVSASQGQLSDESPHLFFFFFFFFLIKEKKVLIYRALDKREYLMIIFLTSHGNHMR